MKTRILYKRPPNLTLLVICENYQDFNSNHLPTMAAALLFDAASLTLFFEHPGNMGLSNRGTCLQLAQESISVPDNFEEFDERTWV